MRRIFFLLASILFLLPVTAQKKNFNYKFYGFVRGDLFYNTRANMAPVDGNFYLYPLDKSPDAQGKDLNATPNGSFYTFTTRLGLDVQGPNIGKARTSAKVETDFGGFSSSTTMLRIRQAYVALDWEKNNLLIGHTWHPLFGSVFPDMLNLSTGAPFQPFNRSPQIRYQYSTSKIKLTASALWQLQYLSSGPKGMSEDYIKNSCIPELYAGADYTSNNGWLVGAGIHLISLKPRTVSEWKNPSDPSSEIQKYKVNERMTTFSYEAHVKYTGRNYTFAAKSLMASCLDHTALIGGYGISSINKETGEQEYTAFRHSTSWINFTYGNKWKPGIFIGYTKNLGTSKELISAEPVYGMGLNIDQLLSVNINLSYNLPHWQIGLEYSPATAWYGTNNLITGKVEDTHSITNHRILGLVMYYF
ncbi:DcaP family trimeric outer membrane transporter [Parabacteroides pacaensis]|uniref:DcaP family trimeric outer membrane transporter n=1 Tax=Parabacteroides pacaensis TaxID=2086575 RepID=UPI000D10AB74|nr:DcaP family trimeric outer membrane transporter [Parabacteroides pacaensis]